MHDTNCLGSPTVETLDSLYGNDGYAVWFKTLELIGNEDDFILDVSTQARWIWYTAKMRCDEEKVRAILDMLVRFGAIDAGLYEEGKIWSQSFVDRLETVLSRRISGIPEKPVSATETPVSATETPVSATETPVSADLCQQKPGSTPVSSLLLYSNNTISDRDTTCDRDTITQKDTVVITDTPCESDTLTPQVINTQLSLLPENPPSKKQDIKSQKQGPNDLAPLVSEYEFSEEVAAAILAWLQYKSERKDKYTPTGFRSQLKQIEKHIEEYGDVAVCDVIQLSMANGWQGIIWDRISARASPVHSGSPDGFSEKLINALARSQSQEVKNG
ncbi:MAG: DUF4373 domain-containing protein [Clostridiales bacterium]|nr:DUF4373 domain-containing protein [Clostridiales bacterium]